MNRERTLAKVLMHAQKIYCPFKKIFKTQIYTRKFSTNNYTGDNTKIINPQLKNIIDTMSKQRTAATQLLQHRVKKSEKTRLSSTIANSMHFQVIGNGTCGNPASVLLRSENNSYLFNCGEGTQRLAHEHKIKFSRLENVFITQSNWQNVSGVLGLTLTLQDIGTPRMTLHGPAPLDSLFELTKGFVPIGTGMQLVTHLPDRMNHVDPCIEITYVPISSSVKSSNFELLAKDLILAYVGKAPDLPGSLDPQKCAQLKIPVGSHLSKLKSGLDIDLPDGRHIKSSDVVGPPKIGPKFIVIDCPDLSYMDSINSNEILTKTFNDGNLKIIVHLTPHHIFCHPQYQEWLNKTVELDCQHLVLNNKGCNPLNYQAIYKMQNQLNLIDPVIFPRIETHGQILVDLENLDKKILFAQASDKIQLRPKMVLERASLASDLEAHQQEALEMEGFEECLKELKPKLEKIDLLASTDCETASKFPEIVFLGTGSAIPSKVRNTSCILVNMSPESSMLLDCGEGSFGQLYRFYGNTESTNRALKRLKLIYISHYHADHHLGLIELIRRRSLIDDVKSRVCLIVPPLLEKWIKDYCTHFEDLREHICIYKTQIFDPIYEKRFGVNSTDNVNQGQSEPKNESLKKESISTDAKEKLDNFSILVRDKHDDSNGEEFNRKNYSNYLNECMEKRKELYKCLPIIDEILTTRVRHCNHAYAIVVKLRNLNGKSNISILNEKLAATGVKKKNDIVKQSQTFTVAYSGDSMPSEEFVEIGRDCDLLIHEATMEDDLADEAIAKRHSTTSQAIDIGQRMGAKFTLLTHFSQRYAKIPIFSDKFSDTVGVAFDNLRLSCPRDLARLPLLAPVLNSLFRDHVDQLSGARKKVELRQKLLAQQQQQLNNPSSTTNSTTDDSFHTDKRAKVS